MLSSITLRTVVEFNCRCMWTILALICMNRFDEVVSFEEYHSGVVNLSREMYDDIDLK